MCGITGFIDLKRQTDDAALVKQSRAMGEALIHRGPDMGDVWVDDASGIAMAFRRLAIIDLSPAGHQPMHSADGRFVMTYNGEIYNYRDLAKDLAASGHSFRGASDSEVMLELFARDGVEATLPRLVGMFAIALWDRRERQLWLIRDRLGIKPLYFGIQDGHAYWASELKAIRAHRAFRAEIDMSALSLFLKGNKVPAPFCIYRGLNSLRPGTFAVIDWDGSLRTGAYWSLEDVVRQPTTDMSDQDIVTEAERVISDAVTSRMVADVPLGALLSGGIDSSTVVALMQQASDRAIKTFTIGFDLPGYDEADHARAVAAHLGTDHTELTLSPDDARDLIPDLPEWYDEPFADSSALPTYLVSHLARGDVTVALSGDGGDEVFFGYNRHKALMGGMGGLNRLPVGVRRLAAGAIAAPGPAFWDCIAGLIPEGSRPRMAGTKAQKVARLLSADTLDARYDALVTHWHEDLTGCPPVERLATPDLSDPASYAAYRDTQDYLPNDILTKVDRASMAVSLEARVPLLDHRVVEFAWTLPTHAKIRGGIQKWALRQVLYRHVPRDLVDRPKSGFAVPLDDWLRGPLRDWAETLLSESRLAARGWVDPAPVRRAWSDHLKGRGARAEALWGMCMLEAWAERWAGLP